MSAALGIGALHADEAVVQLLSSSGLPTGDLESGAPVWLHGAWVDDQLAGCVGLELYDATGLLRSLAVAPRWRRHGVAGELLAHAERQARRRRVETLWLLTMEAGGYFARHGYRRVARDRAPHAIATTAQFSALCPATAQLMVKRLDG